MLLIDSIFLLPELIFYAMFSHKFSSLFFFFFLLYIHLYSGQTVAQQEKKNK